MKKRGFRRSPVRKRLLEKFNDACCNGELGVVLQLIDKVNINQKNDEGWNSFCHLVHGFYSYAGFPRPARDDYTIAMTLVDFGVDTNVRSETLDGRYLTSLDGLLESSHDSHRKFANEIEEYIWWTHGKGIKGSE